MIFKNPANNDTCFSEKPVDGWAEITLAELNEIRESRRTNHTPTPLELIQQLEADSPFTHRNLRDLTLGALKLAALATGGKLEDNPAAMKVMALEQQISILRGEL